MKAPRIHLLVVLGLAASPAMANGQQVSRLARNFSMSLATGTTTTAVSGDPGQERLLAGSAETLLTRLTFWERGDRPCKMTATFAAWQVDQNGDTLADLRTVTTTDASVGNCNGSSGSRQVVGPQFGKAVSGIRICQRRQNDRLKGATVQLQEMTTSGMVPSQPVSEFERPNCNQWQTWVQCPSGALANGIVVHRSSDIITGLALRCVQVSVTAGPPNRNAGIVRLPPGLDILTIEANTTDTEISGLTASEQVLVGRANMSLNYIKFGERNDRPCYLVAGFWTQQRQARTEEVVFDQCQGNYRSERTVSLPRATGSVRLISGVVVCQRSSNDRLKGIRTLGSEITSAGAAADQAISDTEERSNCNEWNAPAACPAGRVAVGLKVHFRPSGNRPSEIVGLGLRCAEARFGAAG